MLHGSARVHWLSRTCVALIILMALGLTVSRDSLGQSAPERTSTGFYWPTGSSELGTLAGWLADSCEWSAIKLYGSEPKYHLGADMKAEVEDPVYAIADGTVLYVHRDDAWGVENDAILVVHKLSDGSEFMAVYGHVLTVKDDSTRKFLYPKVEKGDLVKAGEPFAQIGPWYDFPHLHFGIRLTQSLAAPLGVGTCPETKASLDTHDFVDPVEWLTTRSPLGWPTPEEPRPAPWWKTARDGIVRWIKAQWTGAKSGLLRWFEIQGRKALRWIWAQLTELPRRLPELGAKFMKWIEQQCLASGMALLLPAVACVASRRRMRR